MMAFLSQHSTEGENRPLCLSNQASSIGSNVLLLAISSAKDFAL